jgi:hypothetical protein
MTLVQLLLRWLLVLVALWGVFTTTDRAAAGGQMEPTSGAPIGYDGEESANQGYHASSSRAWNDSGFEMPDASAFFGSSYKYNAARVTPTPTVERIRQVAQQGYGDAVQNPRVSGLNRVGLGKDAEIPATRWTCRWAERNGVDLGPGGLHFQVRGANSVPDMVYNPATQIFDFKLTPKAFKAPKNGLSLSEAFREGVIRLVEGSC